MLPPSRPGTGALVSLDATLRRLRSAWYLRARDWRALARRELRPLRPVQLGESAPSQRIWEPAVPYLGPPGHARASGLERVRLLNHEDLEVRLASYEAIAERGGSGVERFVVDN